MDPQDEERTIFFGILTTALVHLKERGQRLLDDILGDAGFGMGMSAAKLANEAEIIYRLVDAHRIAKESFLSGDWSQKNLDLCEGFIALIVKFKVKVVNALLTVAASKRKEGFIAKLNRFIAWFVPKQSRRTQSNPGYWRPGVLSQLIQDPINKLREILAEADRLRSEVEKRKSESTEPR